MTKERSTQLINTLRDAGVKAFVVCAGSRNSALTLALLESYDLQIFTHFEEREASFFALGLSKRSQKSVCVITTSGTAAAELLPACIEAYYSGVPLVLVTADRPARYRSTGAPQSIEQSTLFGEYCTAWYDIAADEVPSVALSIHGPTHINVCFEESQSVKSSTAINRSQISNFSQTPIEDGVQLLNSALKVSRAPLVVLGELSTENTHDAVAFCRALSAPVFAETLSGLRESAQLKNLLISGSDRVLSRTSFDCVIRLGGVPTCRYWRDLEYSKNVTIISIDSKPFSGLPGGILIQSALSPFVSAWRESNHNTFSVPDTLRAQDEKASKLLHTLIYEYPKAEPSLMYQLSHIVHEHDAIYLGNSLPIREWDLAASHKKPHPLVAANRGANGIDGQISTFLGSIDRARHNWGVFGDLTTLYGLSSLWSVKQLGPIGATLCIVNNGGGKIFERVSILKGKFKDDATRDLFINSHDVSFESWAKMWNLPYEKVNELSVNLRRPGMSIVEIIPNASQTNAFWSAWDEFWKES